MVAPLTATQLALARTAEDWKTLNGEVPRLVRFALRDLKYSPQDYADLYQEGALAGIAAVRTWNPSAGAFTTHVTTRIGYALRDWLRLNRSVVRSRYADQGDVALDAPSVDEADEECGSVVDRLTYDEPPEGFGDLGATLQRRLAPDAADRLLRLAGSRGEAVLRSLYGIGKSRQTRDEIAKERGISQGGVSNIARQALQKIDERQKRGDRRGTGRRNRAREPLRFDAQADSQHVPANRYPGFWNGVAGVIGMGGIWREATGRVWNDWSWKPPQKTEK